MKQGQLSTLTMLVLAILLALPDAAFAFPARKIDVAAVSTLHVDAAHRKWHRLKRHRKLQDRDVKKGQKAEAAQNAEAKKDKVKPVAVKPKQAKAKTIDEKRKQINVARSLRRAACIGGKMVKLTCVCPKGREKLQVRKGVLECLPRGKTAKAERLKTVRDRRQQTRAARILRRNACIGGRNITRECVCPNGQQAVQLRANMLSCLPGSVLEGNVVDVADRSKPRAVQRSIRRFAATELLATMSLSTSVTSLRDLAARNNLSIAQSWPIQLTGKRIVKFRFRDARSLDAVRAALRREPLIVSLQNNFYYGRQSAVTPSGALPQYALDRISAIKAHEISAGSGSLVAIVDSGIDATHPDLQGQILNTFDASENQARLSDPHGTAIAGLVAANGLLLGVAPDAKLLDVRVFDTVPDDGSMVATSESLLRGLDWAAGQMADIINMSLAGPADPLLQEVIAAVNKRGIIVVAAAGNNGVDAEPAYPAAYDDVIAVTATGSDDSGYVEANQGGYIDFAAPGIDLLVTAPDDSYGLETGTSFAAAEVTGIIALLLSQNAEMSRDEITAALAGGAIDIGKSGKDEQFGAGLVNALSSLTLVGVR